MEKLLKEVGQLLDQFANEEIGNRLSQFAMISLKDLVLKKVRNYKVDVPTQAKKTNNKTSC